MQLRTRLTAACAVAFIASTQLAAAAEWTTYQGDVGHTGFVPETLLASETTILWSANPQPRGTGGILVSDGLIITTPTLKSIYLPDEPVVVQDAASGLTLWSANFPDTFVNPATVDGGTLYFQAGKQPIHGASYVYSYTLDGTLLWQTPYDTQGTRYLAPVAADGSVFVAGGYNGGLYSFDAATGAMNWHADLPQYGLWSPTWWRGFILVATNELDMIDASSGANEIAISEAGETYAANQATLFIPPFAYVRKQDRLIAYDLNTQSIAWTRTAYSVGDLSAEMATDGSELFVVDNGALTSIEATTGKLLWSWRPSPSTSVNSNVIVTLSHVIVSNATNTYMVNREKHLVDKVLPVGGDILAFGEGELIVGASLNGGLWAFSVPEEFTSECTLVMCRLPVRR